MTDYSEVLAELKIWYLLGPREWQHIWDRLPNNVREIVLETFGLRWKFQAAKRYLLQLPDIIPSFKFHPYYDFIIHVVLAVNAYGLDGSVPYVQADIENFVSQGLDRQALIYFAGLEGVSGLV